jgi:site-specific DNA recombinase
MKNNIDTQMKRAVIYCRVSTKEQAEEGNSLVSQERLCKEYALQNQYAVERIFIEQGESAKTIDRTELQKLLSFCSEKKNRINAVITYKIDRISRNMDGYSEIRILLKRYGVEIKSTSEFFENTPAGRFMENIIANVAQFDNDVRAERCAGGMKEAVKEGRYVWMAPVGYSNVKVNGKATIAPNEKAPIVLETFKKVATNNHSTEEIWKLMREQGLTNKTGKPIVKSYFHQLLKNEIYTGIVHKFGLRIQGNFEAIISVELFEHVQKVLKGRRHNTRFYKMKNPDFPLRNFIKFTTGEPLSGAWSTGRSKRYPYYWFKINKISERKETLEELFCQLLNQYQLSQDDMRKLTYGVALHVIDKATKVNDEQLELNKQLLELKNIKSKLIIKNVSEVINDSDFQVELKNIEQKIFDLESLLINKFEINRALFVKAVSEIEQYMKDPGITWRKSPYPLRIKLQWFNFPQGVFFDGYNCRTEEIASIYKVKDHFLTPISSRVDYNIHGLNQQDDTKKSYKWLNYLARTLEEEELFWRQVYEDVIKLGAILVEIKSNQDASP